MRIEDANVDARNKFPFCIVYFCYRIYDEAKRLQNLLGRISCALYSLAMFLENNENNRE